MSEIFSHHTQTFSRRCEIIERVTFAVVGVILISLSFATPALAATFDVTKIADTNDGACNADCSLREAIGAANALAGSDTINLPAGAYILGIAGTGEDANATGDLDITGDLTVSGAGEVTTIIDGGGIDRVLTVHAGVSALIDGVMIRNGDPGAGFGAAGILNAGTLTLTNSTVTDNTGDDFGGGLYNTGTLTLTDATVSDNTLLGTNTSGGGGGIFNSGTLTMTRTTISGNSTIGRGGGIYNLDLTATITNSTVSGNTGLNGGGIFNRFGAVNLISSTITDNTATDNGGGIWNFGGTTSFRNTIVSGNMAATPSDDCAGTITSLGHNLASDTSCVLLGAGDLNSTNPLLGPLLDNGGPTMTHALLPGSPAIDAIPVASCTVNTDQRGVVRPQGADCDVGSFEVVVCDLQVLGSVTITICNAGSITNSTTADASTGGNTADGSVGGRGERGGSVGPAGSFNNGGARSGNGGNGGNSGAGGLIQTGNASANASTTNNLNGSDVGLEGSVADLNSTPLTVTINNLGGLNCCNVIDNSARARARTGENTAQGSEGGNGGDGGDIEAGSGDNNNGGASSGDGGAGGGGSTGGTVLTGHASSIANTLNNLNTTRIRVSW